MSDERYPHACKVRLVMDNLNMHNIASIYEAFELQGARCLAERIRIHYTPKHGSWLNIEEIEFRVLKRQCFDQRISKIEAMRNHVAAWVKSRNSISRKIVWQFSASDARVKLHHLYPKL